MSWLVAFDLVNGTIMPAPTSSLVQGVIHPYIEMNQYQAQDGKDYLRFMATN
jgi:hypothetical protein